MMMKWFTLITTLLICVAQVRAQPSLDDVKGKFSSITRLAAVFSQVTIPVYGDSLRFEGSLSISRPANLRMEVSSPEEQLLVFNGERAWLYLPEQNVCYAYTSSNIASFSQIPGYIFDPFESLTVDTFYAIDRTHLFLAFAAPEQDPFLERMDITLSQHSLLPEHLRILDKSGTRTEYLFSDVTINDAVKTDFTLSLPESTEVIQQ
jgi:outer membrane lipoprotein-sorting protein